MGNASNKIYVLARVDDAGLRQVVTACNDKQEAKAVLEEYVNHYRQNGFKGCGYYTEHNEIPGIVSLVRLQPQRAEELEEKGKDFATYHLELYEFEPQHPGDELINLHTGTIWDYLPQK